MHHPAHRPGYLRRRPGVSSAFHDARAGLFYDLAQRTTFAAHLLQLHYRVFPAQPGRGVYGTQLLSRLARLVIHLRRHPPEVCCGSGLDVGYGCPVRPPRRCPMMVVILKGHIARQWTSCKSIVATEDGLTISLPKEEEREIN